mmetsp:Transcript_14148/g.20896  ORF Transcript_14148/g.20896 Transcript_14148/m.20896 type:complete len:137 (-) Transcript_14148:88-498(-)|eukprot:CAMPEP_0194241356 /NCGR_PEP_ID=MMETSP0158-20130606/7246_1 /TAXON_ID=33649 /ORGANISM="Thalassionema nitzschioides, Strain L26-B" /LENGTH=136 /DNA_ID=CAMNT_0038976227 /DNA_START=97 /DNA_END=507 /DNA_ORIENTATION=-
MTKFAILLSFLLISVCFAETLSTGEDVATFVRSRIDGNGAAVFAKSSCPFCQRTNKLLMELQKNLKVVIETVQLDKLPGDDGPLIQKQLLETTGQRTVPNIFIGQRHIGGNSDLQELHSSGKLEAMLIKASGSSEL